MSLWLRAGRGQQGTGVGCRGRAAVGKLTAVCCPPLPALLHQQHRLTPTSQHICQTFSSNKMFGKALLPLEALGCWLSCCSSASGRFVLHPELVQHLHAGSVALVLPPPGAVAAAEAPGASPRAVPTLWVQGQIVAGSLLLLRLTIGAFFPSCLLDHCTE